MSNAHGLPGPRVHPCLFPKLGSLAAAALAIAGLALLPSPLPAAPGDHWWSRGADATGQAAADGIGAVGAAGTFFGSVDLGGGPLLAGNFVGGDVFLVRYGPGGAHSWSRSFTPTMAGVVVSAVGADSSGSLYVAGEIVTGAIDFGGGPIGGTGQIWIAKFDPSGNHLWSDTFGEGGVADLSASASGVAVTGDFAGTVDFGGGAINSAGVSDIFVAVLDPSGTHVWSSGFGDAMNQRGKSIFLGDSGGVGLSGAMQGTVAFGGGPITASATDLFLARFNASGSHMWSQNIPGGFGGGGLIETDLAIGASGTVALGGTLLGSVNFGGGLLVASGPSDAAEAAPRAGRIVRLR